MGRGVDDTRDAFFHNGIVAPCGCVMIHVRAEGILLYIMCDGVTVLEGRTVWLRNLYIILVDVIVCTTAY